MGVEKPRTEKVSVPKSPRHYPVRQRTPQSNGSTTRLASGNLSQHNSSILGSESHAITNRVLDLSFATHVGNIIQVALRVGSIEIDGRRHPAVLHGNHRGRNTGRTAST